MSAEATYTVGTQYRTDATVWDQCIWECGDTPRECSERCRGKIWAVHNDFMEECHSRHWGDHDFCKRWVQERLVQRFMPSFPTDESIWAECRAAKLTGEHRRCRKELEKTHDAFMSYCLGVAFFPEARCQDLLRTKIINGFTPSE